MRAQRTSVISRLAFRGLNHRALKCRAGDKTMNRFVGPLQYRRTLVIVLAVIILFTPQLIRSAAAQAVCGNCSYSYQSPVSEPGGPYVAMRGQSFQFNGWSSWSQYGGITDYEWDFGDGSWGVGPSPSHQYNADGIYAVRLWVCDEMGYWSSAEKRS